MKICQLSHLWYLPIVPVLIFSTVSCDRLPGSPPASRIQAGMRDSKSGGTFTAIFRSGDGGQNWEEVSKGLPADLADDTTRGNRFFTNDSGLFLQAGNRLYYTAANAQPASWTKENFKDIDSSSTTLNPAATNSYWGIHLKQNNGTDVWSPLFDHSSEPRIRSVFETAAGTIFIGTDKGLFKTADAGKTWKHVYAAGWAGNMAESMGVLVSTGSRKIIRSGDEGETWEPVSSEGITWDVKQIRNGFAAITSTSAPDTRTLTGSTDGGKTWMPIGGRPAEKVFVDSVWRTWNNRPRTKAFMATMTLVNRTIFASHPEGIFRSSDKGKTWKLLLPTIAGKPFNILVARNIIYAIAGKGGC